MKRIDDLVDYIQDLKDTYSVCEKKKEEKNSNTLLWILAIIGAVAAVVGIAYAVYRYMTPDYLEDFDDEFEDGFEDDFFDDEDDDEDEEDITDE